MLEIITNCDSPDVMNFNTTKYCFYNNNDNDNDDDDYDYDDHCCDGNDYHIESIYTFLVLIIIRRDFDTWVFML